MKTSTAIRIARAAVSQPIGSGTSWTVYGPYTRNMPNGARAEHSASSYAQARAARTVWVAEVALALLDVGFEVQVEAPNDGTTVEQLVAAGLRKSRLTLG